MKKRNEKKKCFLTSISYFAFCYETYRQIRKTPRLQSAQINFNIWTLCMTKSCQSHPHPSLPSGFSTPSEQKKQPQGYFFSFSSPWEPGDCTLCMNLFEIGFLVFPVSFFFPKTVENLREYPFVEIVYVHIRSNQK